MKTEELRPTPIRRVWTSSPHWQLWDRDAPEISDLESLDDGVTYNFLCDTPVTLGENKLSIGWNRIKWVESTEVIFVPGQHLTQSWMDYAKARLEITGLWPLLLKIGVQRIEASNLPDSPPATMATYRQNTRTLMFRDVAWGPPASLFPACVFHEALHLWDADLSNGVSETRAYMGSQLFHLLNGDKNINVFNSDLYPAARGLG